MQTYQPASINFAPNDIYQVEIRNAKYNQNLLEQQNQQPPTPLQLLAQPIKPHSQSGAQMSTFASSQAKRKITKSVGPQYHEETARLAPQKIKPIEDPLESHKVKLKADVDQIVNKHIMVARGLKIGEESRERGSRIRTIPMPEFRLNKIPTGLNIIGRGVLPSVQFEEDYE